MIFQEVLELNQLRQQAIDRGEYQAEIYLKDFRRFIFTLGLNIENFQLLPAMQPDYCIKCSNKENLNTLRRYLNQLKDGMKNSVLICPNPILPN